MRNTAILVATVVAGVLLSGNPTEAQLERIAKVPGPLMVKDANGVTLGRLASTGLGADGAPAQIVIVTSKNFVVSINADGTRGNFYSLGFDQANCAGNAFALGENASLAFSLPSFVAYHAGNDRYMAATGPIIAGNAAPTLNSKLANQSGTACVTRASTVYGGTRATPVKLMTADEVGLPATVKGPLSVF